MTGIQKQAGENIYLQKAGHILMESDLHCPRLIASIKALLPLIILQFLERTRL